jgi:hypothetical protein
VSQKLFEVTGVPIDPPPEFPSNETTFFLGKVSETLVELAGKNEVAVEEAPPPGREVDLGEVGGILDTVGSTPTPATNADISQLLLVCDLLNYYESDTATESESESVRIQRRREKMRKSPVKKLDASAEETEEDGRLEGDGGGGGAETDPEVRELKNKIKCVSLPAAFFLLSPRFHACVMKSSMQLPPPATRYFPATLIRCKRACFIEWTKSKLVMWTMDR